MYESMINKFIIINNSVVLNQQNYLVELVKYEQSCILFYLKVN